ncbi:MAG: tryptophan synthase alpha chain [Chlamydiales bacterium]|jgi:tryptophan synthase alpha chain
MNRIAESFQKGKVFAAYLTAGDGDFIKSVESSKALIEGGVNLLEIGVPFSEPVADGPVIQQAMSRALSAGATPYCALKLAKEVRRFSDIPLLLFTYYNPILALGADFLERAKESGFDGVLIVDLPLEESESFLAVVKRIGLDPVFVVTPSTSNKRVTLIDAHSEGCIYYACQKGTTGIRNSLPEDFGKQIDRIKKYSRLPVLAGFGISSREVAEEVLDSADGFVVGSAFVKVIGEKQNPEILKEMVQKIDPRSLEKV